MQLVLSGNRIIAHGENFLPMGGGVVINTETGAKHENATVAECNGCPSDIDKVGYEYHAGVFVPCAPYGKTTKGRVMVACKDCATPRAWEDVDRVLLHDYQPTPAILGEKNGAYKIFVHNGKFWALVGHNVYTSTDGFTWSILNTMPDAWSSYTGDITSNENLLIMVMSNNYSYVSADDGATWSQNYLEDLEDTLNLVSGNGITVASGYDSTPLYTNDGITWEGSPSFGEVSLDAVDFCSKFGMFIRATKKALRCSTDGTSWIKICVLDEIFWDVYCCSLGAVVIPSAGVSYTGTSKYCTTWGTWNDITFPFDSMRALTSNNKIAVAASSDKNVLWYSYDLSTWSMAPMPFQADWQSVVYANGIFIASASDDSRFAISTDGINWSSGKLEITNTKGDNIVEALAKYLTNVYGLAYQEGVNEA